jgi:hypothetical protein
VQHRTVSDMAVHLDDHVGSRCAVQYTGILNVGPRFDYNAAKVAAQRCRRPDIFYILRGYLAIKDIIINRILY